MSAVVNKRIAVERGASLHVVGRAGAERLNLDTNTVASGITCAELDRDAARQLRDALDVFLGDRSVQLPEPEMHAGEPFWPTAYGYVSLFSGETLSTPEGYIPVADGATYGRALIAATAHAEQNAASGSRDGVTR
jgi:hypothetical protein